MELLYRSRSIQSLIVGTLLLLMLSACRSKSNGSFGKIVYESRMSDMEDMLAKKDLFISSLSRELSDINTLLERITSKHDPNHKSDPFSYPAERLLFFDSLLQASTARIQNIENQVVETLDPNEQDLLKTVAKDLRRTLADKEGVIRELTQRNQSLARENDQLSDSLQVESNSRIQLEGEIVAKEKNIHELREVSEQEFARLEENRKVLVANLIATKSMVDSEKAEAHFEIAENLLHQYDAAKIGLQIGKKKLRRDILDQAYYHYRQACLFGKSEASASIRSLLTDDSYARDLTIEQTDREFTSCGI